MLSLLFSFLVLSIACVDARAVDTNITTRSTYSISSSIPSNHASFADSSQKCIDINSCRTLNDIVQSCLVTIFACVWFAVHRNVPAPKSMRSRHPNFFVRCAKCVWYAVLDQRTSVMVFVVALLAPEWILAWALRQAIRAWRLAGELEEARLNAIEVKNGRHSLVLERETEDVSGSSDSDDHSSSDSSTVSHLERDAEEVAGRSNDYSIFDRSAASLPGDEQIELINRHSNTSQADATCGKCGGRGCQCDLVAAAERVGKKDQRWNMAHAFFVAMGGFQFYNTDGPLHPLSPENVVKLVARGHLIAPTSEEISNQSKGDALSKSVAVVQTVWFVVQCIARRVEHLSMTNLEVMTLAYTVMTLAMYIAWWDKPLNVSCAIRVPEEGVEGEGTLISRSIWHWIYNYIVGNQDSFVDLRKRKRVPTFWAGKSIGSDLWIADGVALLVAMVFGAVHCIAWYADFRTYHEQQLWRSSAITIIAVPFVLAGFYGATRLLILFRLNSFTILFAMYTLISIMYITARFILIILSFTSLRELPVDAYQTVQWTRFIPHI